MEFYLIMSFVGCGIAVATYVLYCLTTDPDDRHSRAHRDARQRSQRLIQLGSFKDSIDV